MLERLGEMGKITIDEILEDPSAADALRFHAIDETDPHTTMRRADFSWLDSTYLDDADSFEIYQFHVSKALGRIVGFFDEHKVFCVLLLDAHHNLQLSRFSSYEIRACHVLESEHEVLRSSVDKALGHVNEGQYDRAKSALVKATIDRTGPDGEARVVVTLQKSDAKQVEQMLSANGKTVRDIVEAGLLAFLDEASAALKLVKKED